MNKLKFALIPAGCFLLGAVCNYINAADARKAAGQFRSFTGAMFQREVSSSTLNLHYTLEHPEDYGITDYPVTYGETKAVSTVLSETEPAAEDYQKALASISYDDLTEKDRITYDILLLSLEEEQRARDFMLYEEPLGPTIGVQAQLPILLSEYAFRDRRDITEYLELTAQTDRYFSSLLAMEKARSKAGLFMSDSNADAIIAQCRAFIGSKDTGSHLLVTVFNEKVDALDFLSAREREEYKAENRKIVAGHIFPAYELLIEGLETLKGTGTNENGLCYFPDGRAYYEYLVRDATGSYLPLAAIERRIRRQLEDDILACRQLLQDFPEVSGEELCQALPQEPEAVLHDLQEKMSADYPRPPAASFQIKYVHPSLEHFLSPAFYLTPPIDNADENVIYINNASVSSPLELYTTLAHEGYPGHLYQNISARGFQDPVRSLFSFGGYTEGWATYVEMDSFAYAAEHAPAAGAAAAEFSRLNRSVMLGLSSLLDICIHYHGFTREDTAEFLKNLGFVDTGSADAIFDAILESPANYLKYYLGYLSFSDLRSYCRKNWPEKFTLRDFHAQVLRIGPAPFPVLEKYLKLYYRSK